MSAQQISYVGPQAAARKYDLLTVLALLALDDGPLSGARGLRLIALITAHYDWRRDRVSIGHDALIKLWAVSRRTVIRDLNTLRDLGVLEVLEPGRRGRVGTYRLGHTALEQLTAPYWDRLGPSFAQRMAPQAAPQISAQTPAASWRRESDGDWAAAQERLSLTLNPSAMAQWIAPLRIRDVRGDTLRLNAPSSFHADYVTRNHGARIEAAVRATYAQALHVEIAAG